MNIEELEEALNEILPRGFTIDTDDDGQLIVYTHLVEDEDGELYEYEGDEEEDEEDEDSEDEEFYELDEDE